MMECIKLVTDADFGKEVKELNDPIVRYGARGIVLRADGKMAVFHKAKMNEYKLPGGGIDKGETPEQAFKRECIEEIGCEVEIIQELGYTEERKGYTNFKQISHIFVGRVTKDLGAPEMTEKEIAEGSEILWVSPDEAYNLIAGCADKVVASPCDVTEGLYSTKFVVARDMNIMNYFLNVKKNILE